MVRRDHTVDDHFTITLKKFEHANQLPNFLADDKVQIYTLRSKVLPLIKTPIGSFMAQSSGIALRSKNTNEVIVIEVVPQNASLCHLPTIIKDPTRNSVRLLWDKTAAVMWANHVDTEYWMTSTYLADVNGVVYSHFLEWAEKTWAQPNTFYLPHSLCSSPLTVSSPDCYYNSRTSDVFLAGALTRFASLAVELSPLTPPRASDLTLFSTQKPVDMFMDNLNVDLDTELGMDIFNYYSILTACIKEKNEERSANGVNQASGDFATLLSYCNFHFVEQTGKGGGYESQPSSFLHLGREHYVRFISNHPYATLLETSTTMPRPTSITAPGTTVSDKVIAGVLLVLFLIGIIASLHRVRLLQYCWKQLTTTTTTRISKGPSIEGGYSQASELPRYVEWSWMSGRSPARPMENLRYDPLPLGGDDSTVNSTLHFPSGESLGSLGYSGLGGGQATLSATHPEYQNSTPNSGNGGGMSVSSGRSSRSDSLGGSFTGDSDRFSALSDESSKGYPPSPLSAAK
jgi:hypothetical protein